jgi:hypothetical protein
VKLDASEALADRTIAELAELIERRATGAARPERAAPSIRSDAGAEELSYGQRALWYLHRLDPSSTAYNLTAALELHGDVDVFALVRALDAVVGAHAALRTRIREVDGEPRGIVDPKPIYELQRKSFAKRSALDAALADESARPFSLADDPPVRVAVYELGDGGTVLWLCVHHHAVDLVSAGVLARDIAAAYARAASASASSCSRPSARTRTTHAGRPSSLPAPTRERRWTTGQT